jgi:hypothetical protein
LGVSGILILGCAAAGAATAGDFASGVSESARVGTANIKAAVIKGVRFRSFMRAGSIHAERLLSTIWADFAGI